MFINRTLLGTPRFIIRYDKFMLSVNSRITMNKDRMTKSNIGTSPPLVFIKHLLEYIAEPRYLTNDIFDVYTEDILTDVAMVGRKFDSTESGTKLQTNLFVKGSKFEFLIPTSGIIGTKVSVLDGWDKWETIQPIRIVAHNSRELNVMDYETQLVFKKDKPRYVVVCIDVSALLLKYIIYLRTFNLTLDNPNIDEFILKYVLAYIYDDMRDIWVTNYLSDVVEGKPINPEMISNVLSVSELDNATLDITELISKYKRGVIKLGDLSKTMFYGHKSLMNMFDLYEDTCATYISNRYIGAGLIKMSGILSIYLELLRMNMDKQQDTASIRKLRIDLDILSRKNWRTHVRSPYIIAEIESVINRAYTLELDRYIRP